MVGTVDVPEGATPAEAAALHRMRRISYILDDMIRIPYTQRRVGLDPLLGIAPVVGDAIPVLFIFYQYAEAFNLDAPRGMYLRMLFNHGVDFVFGSIPLIGVVFDALWKASDRNVDLLEDLIAERAAERLAARRHAGEVLDGSPDGLATDGSGGDATGDPGGTDGDGPGDPE